MKIADFFEATAIVENLVLYDSLDKIKQLLSSSVIATLAIHGAENKPNDSAARRSCESATKKIFLKRKNDKSLSTTTSSSSSTYITTPVNCSPAHSRRTSTSSINNSTITSTTTNSNDYNIHTLGSSTTPSTGEMVVTSGQLVLSTIENSFSNYLPIIGIISSLCERIIKSYETVKDNKKICGVLIDRVELTHLAVKQLVRAKEENEENFREESYFKAFNRLQKVLENIENFIKNMSNYGAFKHFVNAEHCKKCFEDYCDDLDKVCADLQFNITIRIYHNLEKMWEIFYESFKNVGTLETQGKLVLIGKLNKSMKTNDFDFNQELLKIPKIDTNEIEDRTVDVACKYIVGDLKDVNDAETKKFHGQLIILNAIQCEYIVKFYGTSNVNSRNVLIFGWAEKGNLKDLYETNYINWITKLKIAYDVIKGLIFMHRCKILHRDVRCENILIDEKGNPKISNFHLSREVSQPSKKVERMEDYLPWLAPEKIPTEKISADGIKPNSRRYDFYCEMFSFGMLLWELTYQQVPYKGKKSEKIKDYVLSGQREIIKIGKYNKEIQSAWETVPYERHTFGEVMDVLTGLWKKHGSCNYLAKFLPKNEISDDKLHSHSIEKPTDFEKVEFKRKVFEPLIQMEEGKRAYKEENNFKKAWKCFCDNADLNDYEAIYWKAYFLEAGKANESGEATQENIEEATRLYKIAADNGIADAQTQYAFLIYKKDKTLYLEEFKRYLQLAAKNENSIALLNLGNFYLKGTHGYEQNINLARQYLQSAALQGHNEEIKRRAIELINSIEKSIENL
ncbi:15175_t:CDS:2 [Entrophospora sp. SA101]|nr:15175_t:CDS:2 [Entrophospora sp. SA101]